MAYLYFLCLWSGFQISVEPRHLVFRNRWHHFIDHRSSLCHSISLSRTERNGTERNRMERMGTEKQTSQLCWNLNDQILIQSVFV